MFRIGVAAALRRVQLRLAIILRPLSRGLLLPPNFCRLCVVVKQQVPNTSDGADEGLQNQSAEAVDSSRKSGKQRDKDGHREGNLCFCTCGKTAFNGSSLFFDHRDDDYDSYESESTWVGR